MSYTKVAADGSKMFDQYKYRRDYEARHPEKRKLYRYNQSVNFIRRYLQENPDLVPVTLAAIGGTAAEKCGEC